ncbi:uncharacterized protein FFC1_15918 [Fusarium fujikuroi]|nr:uncharacterized protein FFC1_15918 [Fusarium fujikuroi]
MYKSTTIIII